uniref:Uncharacterized protein n=1 Tax=Meloidogyne enterolobii TaxID=390850 RepID=A0A6V7UWU7_MELEN|nr:unnamed protein product [Meloidogyne enterolobii]
MELIDLFVVLSVEIYFLKCLDKFQKLRLIVQLWLVLIIVFFFVMILSLPIV